jgi:hypothetical protein
MDINISDELKIFNEIIEDLPPEFIRQLKINYDARFISIILLKLLNEDSNRNKIIPFTKLKYDDYKMEDIYYLISKIASNINSITFFPNYKKDGFNIFINKILTISLYKNNNHLTIEFL